jgi:hypothetical protein
MRKRILKISFGIVLTLGVLLWEIKAHRERLFQNLVLLGIIL